MSTKITPGFVMTRVDVFAMPDQPGSFVMDNVQFISQDAAERLLDLVQSTPVQIFVQPENRSRIEELLTRSETGLHLLETDDENLFELVGD